MSHSNKNIWKHLAEHTSSLAIAAGFLLCASTASATTFKYEADYVNNGVTNTNYSYDTVSEELSVSFSADPSAASFGGKWRGEAIDGFWLVLSDGANPQTGAKNDSAILYADLSNNVISAYVYTNIGSAYHTEEITRFDGALNVNRNGAGADVSFTIDASEINAFSSHLTSNDWRGVAFGNKIGTWLHPSFASHIRYDKNGSLRNFNWSGWIGGDESNKYTTTEVPEPASMLLLMSGLGGLAAKRRKKKSV